MLTGELGSHPVITIHIKMHLQEALNLMHQDHFRLKLMKRILERKRVGSHVPTSSTLSKRELVNKSCWCYPLNSEFHAALSICVEIGFGYFHYLTCRVPMFHL